MYKALAFVSTVTLQCVAIAAVVAHAEPLQLTVSYNTDIQPQYVEIDSESQYCLNEAIYWEGRNQEIDGMIAIGQVILNRVASSDFPDSVCGVVHQGPLDGTPITRNRCQFSYYCDGLSDAPPTDNIIELQAWFYADAIAEGLLMDYYEDETGGSTYYHADYVDPFWNEVYAHNATIGEHLFYVHIW